jgi:hypothetical protein
MNENPSVQLTTRNLISVPIRQAIINIPLLLQVLGVLRLNHCVGSGSQAASQLRIVACVVHGRAVVWTHQLGGCVMCCGRSYIIAIKRGCKVHYCTEYYSGMASELVHSYLIGRVHTYSKASTVELDHVVVVCHGKVPRAVCCHGTGQLSCRYSLRLSHQPRLSAMQVVHAR